MPAPTYARHVFAQVLGVAALALLFTAPLIVMVLGSLGTPGLPPPDGSLDLIPDSARWRNYEDAATITPLASQVRNSMLVVAVAVPVSVLVASLGGFAIVTGSARLRRTLIVASVLALLVPAAALWVPRVVLLKSVGVAGHPLSVTFPALVGTSPLFVLLFAVSCHQIPRTIFDAARSEGLSAWRTWWAVALPLSRPAVFAVAALSFVAHWANVIEPLLLLTRAENQTAALGIRTLGSLEPTFYPIFLAGAVIVTVPAVTVFLLAQRAFFHTGAPLPRRRGTS